MKREPVKSTNVASIGYDEKTQVLEVEFKYRGFPPHEEIYQYADVPPVVFSHLMESGVSIGSFISQHVAKNYTFKKVS